MSDKKNVFLLAGGRPLSPEAAVRSFASVFGECESPRPRLAYIGTANGDNGMFFDSMKRLMLQAGAGEVSLMRLARNKADVAAVREYLESADAVFLSGGEVEDGMMWLVRHGLDSFLKELYSNGKLFFGLSAGSIMMGTHWVRWDDPDDDDTASLFDCLGFVPTVFDTHAEDEDWKELKTALRLLGPGAKGYGIPSGGVISADGTGKLTNLQKEPLLFMNAGGSVKRV